MDIPKNIFLNNKSNIGSSLPTFESFEKENMDYMIPEIISGLMESSFSVIKDHMTATYFSIKYDNANILEEGFAEFKEKVSNWFEKAKEVITKTGGTIIKKLQSYMFDFGKFIEKNKSALEKSNPDFHVKGHNYKILEDSPSLIPFDDFIKDFNSKITKTEDITKEYIEGLRTEFAKQETKDTIRANILNDPEKKTLSGGDKFVNEIEKSFGMHNEHKIAIHVDNSKINEIISEYSKIKNSYETIRKEREDILKKLEQTRLFFKRHVTEDKNSGYRQIATTTLDRNKKRVDNNEKIMVSHTAENLSLLNNYYDFQFEKVSMMYTCYINVYFKKISALKGWLNQSRHMIRKSLKNLNDGNTKPTESEEKPENEEKKDDKQEGENNG